MWAPFRVCPTAAEELEHPSPERCTCARFHPFKPALAADDPEPAQASSRGALLALAACGVLFCLFLGLQFSALHSDVARLQLQLAEAQARELGAWTTLLERAFAGLAQLDVLGWLDGTMQCYANSRTLILFLTLALVYRYHGVPRR